MTGGGGLVVAAPVTTESLYSFQQVLKNIHSAFKIFFCTVT